MGTIHFKLESALQNMWLPIEIMVRWFLEFVAGTGGGSVSQGVGVVWLSQIQDKHGRPLMATLRPIPCSALLFVGIL